MVSSLLRTFAQCFYLVFSGVYDPVAEFLQDCTEGMNTVKLMECTMYRKGFISAPVSQEDQGELSEPFKPGVVKIESDLLHLGCLDDICHGVFFFLPIELEHCVVVRYIESGCYRGFYEVAEEIFQTTAHVPANKPVIPWKVYTDRDFELAKPAKKGTGTVFQIEALQV